MPRINLAPGDEAWVVDTTNKVSVQRVEVLDRHPRPGHDSDIEYTVRYQGGRVYRVSQYLVFPTKEDAEAKLQSRVENRRDRDLAHAAKMQKWLDEHLSSNPNSSDETPVQGPQSESGDYGRFARILR